MTAPARKLFPTRYALDPVMIAEKLGGILIEEGRGTEGIKAGLDKLTEVRRNDNAPEIAVQNALVLLGLSA
jgi:indolepyruvate ferredoxin oxidoreductase